METQAEDMPAAENVKASRPPGRPLPDISICGSGFGQPHEHQGMVNKKQTGKGRGVIFLCALVTSANHVEFVESYR
jgi:hypothetical protein